MATLPTLGPVDLAGLGSPDGQVFRAVRGLAIEDMRGKRWARLFP